MSNYFYANLGSSSAPALTVAPINLGDSNIYLRITGDHTITPGTKVKAIAVPNGMTVLPDPVESFSVSKLLIRLRGDKVYNDTTYGMFSFIGGENNSDVDTKLSFSDLKINDYFWENKKFDIHWIYQLGDSEYYGSVSGIYTYPHNIQNNEVVISGTLSSTNNIDYQLHWNTIANETDANYGITTDGPYRLKITYESNSGVATSFNSSNWKYYPATTMSSGIYFSLPYMDPRTQSNTPAKYHFHLTNVSASSGKPGSNDKVILINHQEFLESDSYFKNLDDQVFTSPIPDKLKRVGQIDIAANTINRKRFSIGINDISIKDNIYTKQGTYISPYYPLDFTLYTLSLKTKEFIPEYPNIYKYDIIKYFIEVNSIWERISPINRGDELSNNKLIPKILVFDKGLNEDNQVKYIDTGSVNLFRVKIVFDLSGLTESRFVPPEVYDYKCIIFDRNQLNEL